MAGEGKIVQIVLDADVIIHFSKGTVLCLLPQIFPEYQYVVLDKVYEELKSVKSQLDRQMHFFGNMSLVEFTPAGEAMQEYARLKTRFGKGESACMVYCRYGSEIIGSSNLKDIRQYCVEHDIVFLTTMDFLYYAWKRGLLKVDEITAFISEVRAKGSRLPEVDDITKYIPNALI